MRKIPLLFLSALLILCSCSGNNSSDNNQIEEATSADLKNSTLKEFSQDVVDDMLRVKAVEEDAYYTQLQAEDAYETLESFDSLEFDKPYQAAIADCDRYAESVNKLLDIYILSKEDIVSQQRYDCKNINYYPSTEILSQTLLAGDRNEYVMAVAFRYALTGSESDDFLKSVSDWTYLYEEDDISYLYGTVAVHAIMVKDYIYELSGIADCAEAVSAFSEKYPDYNNVYSNVEYAYCLPSSDCMATTDSGTLLVTYDKGGNWSDVPVSTQLLYARGDEQSGALTSLQDGCSYISKELTAFAYGGSMDVPLSVIISTYSGKSWSKHEISSDYKDVRQIWLCCPDSKYMYVIISAGRTMSQEGNVVFLSKDSGATWNEVPTDSDLLNIHFVTNDATFTDNSTGFICIQSTESPDMLVTHDGGATWEKADLSCVPAGYSVTWAPEPSDDGLTMYVGETDSASKSGALYELISVDNGVTWTLGSHLVVK